MSSVRSTLAALCAATLAACATQEPAPAGAASPAVAAAPGAPADWQPLYWDKAMREAQQARDGGDRATAERACARGILYVQAQAIKVLQGYADTLDQQKAGSGAAVRARAQKLEQARDEQAQARRSGNTYLGFDPAAELKAYADLLAGLNRRTDSLAVEALSSAYLYAQSANLRRTVLQRDGKDPLGEC